MNKENIKEYGSDRELDGPRASGNIGDRINYTSRFLIGIMSVLRVNVQVEVQVN